MKRILILGGGFAGLHAALEFEQALRGRNDLEVTLVNRENYFLYTPMLHEVAASDVDVTNIVSPAHKLLRRVRFMAAEVAAIDLERKTVEVHHGPDRHSHDLEYDYLVLGLGSVTNFFGTPGVEGCAVTMKSLGDAIELRNRLIAQLEEADSEACTAGQHAGLTFVVAGGGFAGVETIAGMNDFLHDAVRFYPHLKREHLRLVLVHSGEVILPELGPKLGRYAEEKLRARGVEILTGTKVTAASARAVTLSDQSIIPARCLVWAAGTAPSPLLAGLAIPLTRGRVEVSMELEVQGQPGVFALGDCALVPDGHGGYHPPTAQHALRQGRVVAKNILAAIDRRPRVTFRYRTIGLLAAIGHRAGVADVFGFKFSGFFAWWLWRTVYLAKLPRLEKKIRVMLDWTLDLFFSKDLVQFQAVRAAERAGELRRGEGSR